MVLRTAQFQMGNESDTLFDSEEAQACIYREQTGIEQLKTVRRHDGSDLTSRVALVYGPIEYQGLGIPNLYTSQGIAHIERILKYSHIDDDVTGHLMQVSMEHLNTGN
jgi:hypothetical protein